MHFWLLSWLLACAVYLQLMLQLKSVKYCYELQSALRIMASIFKVTFPLRRDEQARRSAD